MSGRRIVTVDGLDGSGKSVLARRLAEALGGQAVRFAVDDFRRPVDWTRADRSELDLYYDARYDLAELDRCLAEFQAGAPGCRYRTLAGESEALGDETPLAFGQASVAIVEGVFVARLAGAEGALSIYLDIPREEAWRRVVARDLGKGRTQAEIERRIQRRYLPAHERYLAECRPRDRARLVIDNQVVAAPGVIRAAMPGDPGWQPVRAALGGLGLSLSP